MAATQMSAAIDAVRLQGDQTAKAAAEQSRTMRDMAAAAQTTARDIQVMTQANREQSVTAASLLTQLDDIRRITDRNTAGVKQARGGTADLLRQAETLSGIMSGVVRVKGGSNGRARG
jgi:methyl-accepting chemotaxis protein